MMAEEKSSRNEACLVNCYGSGGRTVAAELLTELVGRRVEQEDDAVLWRVENKYYSAEVHFTLCSSSSVPGRQWEAILILCDLNKPYTFEAACKAWEDIADDTSPSVCLLVGTMTTSPGQEQSCHQTALEWCVGKGFELVEWEREGGGGGEEEEEEDFPESTGVERVSEALQAHVWPDMTLRRGEGGRGVPQNEPSGGDEGVRVVSKATTTAQPAPDGSRDEGGRTAASIAKAQSNAPKPIASQERIDSLLSAGEEELLAEGLGDDQDPGGESFERLFARFAQMKDHAQSLPHEERKEYAENVVMSFWKAIGGDEDEVRADSDSDS